MIEITGVLKSFGEKKVLLDLNLEVKNKKSYLCLDQTVVEKQLC